MILHRLLGGMSAGDLAGDVAGQVVFEADAKRSGLHLTREERARALVYHFEVGVPGSHDLRAARAEFIPGRENPAVFLDGPYCLRHRWSDDSLCMWTPEDGPENRWVLSDGLPRMAEHIALHAFCEGECRAGKPWPKAEGPGEHPRKRACPSCRGRGR